MNTLYLLGTLLDYAIAFLLACIAGPFLLIAMIADSNRERVTSAPTPAPAPEPIPAKFGRLSIGDRERMNRERAILEMRWIDAITSGDLPRAKVIETMITERPFYAAA